MLLGFKYRCQKSMFQLYTYTIKYLAYNEKQRIAEPIKINHFVDILVFDDM